MGQLMLNGGELMGRRIVSEDWVLRATTPNASINDKAYGYQWWLNSGNDELRFRSYPRTPISQTATVNKPLWSYRLKAQ